MNCKLYYVSFMYMILLFILVIVTKVHVAESARIVGFPLNTYSHTANLIRVGEQLQLRGHSYTILVSTWVRDMLKTKLPFNSVIYQSYVNDDFVKDCLKEYVFNRYTPPLNCTNCYSIECVNVAADKGVIKAIAEADLLVCDLGAPCCHVMAKITRVPLVVDYSPVAVVDPFFSTLHKIPNNPAYVPQLLTDYSNKMKFFERVGNLFFYFFFGLIKDYSMAPPYNQILRDRGISEKIYIDRSPAAMLLMATDFAIEFPRPITPAIKVIGPVLARPAKSLPPELEDFVNSNDNGFVYVSFGTVATALDILTDVKEMAIGLGQLPYNVLWKYKEPAINNVSDNIKLVDWAPQNDVLGHANIKAFVSHCGMNGMLEAAYHGVPMVGIPLLADQPGNAQKIIVAKMGRMIKVSELDADVIMKGVMDIASNVTYRENAQKISKIIRYRPSGRSPVEEAGDWIEYALKFDGGEHLRSEEYNLSFYQRYLLDVLGALFLILYVIYRLIKIVCRYLCSCYRVKVKQA